MPSNNVEESNDQITEQKCAKSKETEITAQDPKHLKEIARKLMQ